MRVSGERSFAAPRDVVWQVLNDPERMAAAMPGIERFEVRDADHWIAHVLVPLGLGGLRMKINFDKTEQRVRYALARWPDGTHEAEGYMDNDGIDLERRRPRHRSLGAHLVHLRDHLTGAAHQRELLGVLAGDQRRPGRKRPSNRSAIW